MEFGRRHLFISYVKQNGNQPDSRINFLTEGRSKEQVKCGPPSGLTVRLGIKNKNKNKNKSRNLSKLLFGDS